MELISSHKHIKNTSTWVTTHREHLQTAGRRPQTSKRSRKPPHNGVGTKKEEKKRQREESGQDLYTREGAVKEERLLLEREPCSLGGECSNRSVEGKESPGEAVSRSTLYSLAWVVCLLVRAGTGC